MEPSHLSISHSGDKSTIYDSGLGHCLSEPLDTFVDRPFIGSAILSLAKGQQILGQKDFSQTFLQDGPLVIPILRLIHS